MGSLSGFCRFLAAWQSSFAASGERSLVSVIGLEHTADSPTKQAFSDSRHAINADSATRAEETLGVRIDRLEDTFTCAFPKAGIILWSIKRMPDLLR
jgi:hypothetical protein